MLKFSKANAKNQNLSDNPSLSGYLAGNRKVYSLDLLSGWNCPGAKDCKSKVKIVNGKRKVVDGSSCQFRCFSAMQECIYPKVYTARKHNADLLRGKSRKEIRTIILNSLPENAGIIRLHVAGDFFSRDYLLAIKDVASIRQDILFYGYT